MGPSGAPWWRLTTLPLEGPPTLSGGALEVALTPPTHTQANWKPPALSLWEQRTGEHR